MAAYKVVDTYEYVTQSNPTQSPAVTLAHKVFRAHFHMLKIRTSLSYTTNWPPIFNSMRDNKYYRGVAHGQSLKGGVRLARAVFLKIFFNLTSAKILNINGSYEKFEEFVKPKLQEYKVDVWGKCKMYAFVAFSIFNHSIGNADADKVYQKYRTSPPTRKRKGKAVEEKEKAETEEEKERPKKKLRIDKTADKDAALLLGISLSLPPSQSVSSADAASLNIPSCQPLSASLNLSPAAYQLDHSD